MKCGKKLTASALMLSLAATNIAHVENTSAAAIDSNEVTRGEYVKKVIETMGLELGTGKTVKFEDVPDS